MREQGVHISRHRKVTFSELCGRKYPGLPHIFACLINMLLKVEFDYPAITLLSKVHTRIPKLSEHGKSCCNQACYSMAFAVLLYGLCGVTLWPLWCYSMVFAVLLYGLYGVTLWPLWCYSMDFVGLLYGLCGVTLWPLWCYSMAFVVLLYHLCGVTLWPLWCYSMAFVVLLYGLCGVPL